MVITCHDWSLVMTQVPISLVYRADLHPQGLKGGPFPTLLTGCCAAKQFQNSNGKKARCAKKHMKIYEPRLWQYDYWWHIVVTGYSLVGISSGWSLTAKATGHMGHAKIPVSSAMILDPILLYPTVFSHKIMRFVWWFICSLYMYIHMLYSVIKSIVLS